MLKKNEIHEMLCDSLGLGAQGVCHHEGMAVFVPNLLPGETADVRIVKVEKRYAFGRVEHLKTCSADRQPPFCPSYRRCGGCVCQHMSYPASLAFKRDQVRELLRRIGKVEVEVPEVLGMDNPYHYRNKATYPVAQLHGRLVCGFYAPRSHDLIPLPEMGCQIQDVSSLPAVNCVLSWAQTHHLPAYDELTGKGSLRYIMTRSNHEGRMIVCLVTTTAQLPCTSDLISSLQEQVPCISSLFICVNRNKGNAVMSDQLIHLWGDPVLHTLMCGLKFDVSPVSFLQVNHIQTEKLYSIALQFAGLTGSETVLDAYCGAGTISLMLSRHCAHVVGIEIVEDAIRNAWANARNNHCDNVEFHAGAVESVLPSLAEKNFHPDVVVLDPPRKGCEASVIDALCLVRPSRIVYISCNPSTLARDLSLFSGNGYHVRRIQCVDMFCWTDHIETIVLLQKLNS